MRRFYQQVDCRSRAAMITFLDTHPRYWTMHSWNRSQSYACNLKIDRLGLEPKVLEKLYEMLGMEEFFDPLNDLMREFGAAHDYKWQAAMNGRSGGYLVLYQGDAQPSDYKSYCTQCGQRNYRNTVDSGTACGKCGAASRRDYITPPIQIATYPGRGTDDGEDFEDWSMAQLRVRVALVQELDRLADDIVVEAVYMANHYAIEEEVEFVPRTKRVLVECAS